MNSIKTDQLRDLLRARFPEAHARAPDSEVIKTGIQCFDQARVCKGSLCEIIALKKSTAAGLLLMALLEHGVRVLKQPVALVDAADCFDPASAAQDTLEGLLWLRTRNVERAVQAADMLVRDGNVPLVVFDVRLCSARNVRAVLSTSWHRLRLLAEKRGVTLCVFSAFQTVPCARSRLFIEHEYTLSALDDPREVLMMQLREQVAGCAADPVESGAVVLSN